MNKDIFKRVREADIEDAVILEEHSGPYHEIPETLFRSNTNKGLLSAEGRKQTFNLLSGHARLAKTKLAYTLDNAMERTRNLLDRIEVEIPVGRFKTYLIGFDRRHEDGSLEFYCEPNF